MNCGSKPDVPPLRADLPIASLLRRLAFASVLLVATSLSAQLDPNCTAGVQNRSATPDSSGTFAIPNVPVDVGLFKVRIHCGNSSDGNAQAQSEFVTMVPNTGTIFRQITFGTVDPIPVSLKLTSPKASLAAIGETAQLSLNGSLPDGTNKDLTTSTTGTTYQSSGPSVATVSASGLVTAVSRGRVFITARNEGNISAIPDALTEHDRARVVTHSRVSHQNHDIPKAFEDVLLPSTCKPRRLR